MEDLTTSTAAELKSQLKAADPALPNDLATRLHRAISWLQAAEEAVNDDMEFIALWIAFSACCSIDQHGDAPLEDHEQFLRFVGNLVRHDGDNQIYTCLWEEYSTHVKALIRNPYVFHPFWVSQREGNDDWQGLFDQSSVSALNALSRGRVTELCSIVLDRLFVLRNQLIFGGATYKGRVNRDQVTDGSGLLGTLLPIMIRIMLRAGDEDWGNIAYPVVGPVLSSR